MLFEALFQSKAQRQEKDYLYLTAILKEAGLDTPEKINVHMKNVLSRAYYASLIITIIISALWLLTPDTYIPIWLILALMLFAWTWRSAITARRIMQRYIDEELSTHTNNETTE